MCHEETGPHTNQTAAETAKVRRLRTSLGARSNSEAARRAIDERLAINGGIEALQKLQALGGLEDVLRARRKKPMS